MHPLLRPALAIAVVLGLFFLLGPNRAEPPIENASRPELPAPPAAPELAGLNCSVGEGDSYARGEVSNPSPRARRITVEASFYGASDQLLDVNTRTINVPAKGSRPFEVPATGARGQQVTRCRATATYR